MKKILLTGGTGFIGSHTAVEVLNSGCDIVIADYLSNSEESVVSRIEKITGKRPVFYNINVADKTELSRLFERQDIDAVIHFAGIKAVGESVEKPLDYYRNNLDTTMTLLEVMKQYQVKKIIFSSSATVYSLIDEVPFTEESGPLGCTNPYVPIDRDGAQLLFRVIADSYEQKSLILTTNLEFSKWGSMFTDDQMTAAMIDRLIHHGHMFIFDGKSYRMEHALMGKNADIKDINVA